MRIFHLSDLHIGLKLMNHDLREDQIHVFDQIVEYAVDRKPDVIVIAGDIYDKAIPSADAVEIFDYFITKLSDQVPDTKIMMISGNHDSAMRVNVYRNILSRQNLYTIGVPPTQEGDTIAKVTVEDEYGPVHFYLLPFVKPTMVKMVVGTDENGNNLSYEASIRRLIEQEEINTQERNVIVSHQFYLPQGKDPKGIERMDSEIYTVGNIDSVSVDVIETFDYGALGHIHKPMKVGSDVIRYCGTPLACSVSEAGQDKGIIEVNMKEKGTVETRILPLVPLRQIKIIKGSLEEVLEQRCEDYVTIILTEVEKKDSFDIQDRLRIAFPNLLEIRRDVEAGVNLKATMKREIISDPFELCLSFLGEAMDESDQDILADVIRTVQGVK